MTIHAAHTVGVAIGHEADVMRMLLQICLAARVIFLNRLWIDAAKHDIVRAVQRRDLAGRSRQDRVKATCADAEERVVCEAQFRFRDELEVHQFFQRSIMRRTNVEMNGRWEKLEFHLPSAICHLLS